MAIAINVRNGDKAKLAGRWNGVGGNATTEMAMECQTVLTAGRMTPSAVDVTVTEFQTE
jgi:hypothetical protein